MAVWLSVFVNAQTDSLAPKIKLSAYLEGYYCFDNAPSTDRLRSALFCSYNRHSVPAINIAVLKLDYSGKKIRSNLGFMTGTYASTNLKQEPVYLQFIYEANIGIKLSKSRHFWLDAGVMPSHIGFESPIGNENWTLTRSLVAENSPYYESGARLSFLSKNNNCFFGLLLINNWQRIGLINGTIVPAGGHSFYWNIFPQLKISSNSFFGKVIIGTNKNWRFYHNLFLNVKVSEKFGLIVGCDNGWQESIYKSARYQFWFSPIVLARYQLLKALFVAARVEYFSDGDNTIVSLDQVNGISIWGYSLNFDYKANTWLCWRLETRLLSSATAVFGRNNNQFNRSALVSGAMIVSLAKRR